MKCKECKKEYDGRKWNHELCEECQNKKWDKEKQERKIEQEKREVENERRRVRMKELEPYAKILRQNIYEACKRTLNKQHGLNLHQLSFHGREIIETALFENISSDVIVGRFYITDYAYNKIDECIRINKVKKEVQIHSKNNENILLTGVDYDLFKWAVRNIAYTVIHDLREQIGKLELQEE